MPSSKHRLPKKPSPPRNRPLRTSRRVRLPASTKSFWPKPPARAQSACASRPKGRSASLRRPSTPAANCATPTCRPRPQQRSRSCVAAPARPGVRGRTAACSHTAGSRDAAAPSASPNSPTAAPGSAGATRSSSKWWSEAQCVARPALQDTCHVQRSTPYEPHRHSRRFLSPNAPFFSPQRPRAVTKADIVDRISKGTGLTKIETEAVVEGFMTTVAEALKEGEHIELRGFGSFKVVRRAPRTARNPRTGEEVPVEARWAPVFDVSDLLREDVDEAVREERGAP
ncbi:MAG: hypothetical protein BRD44_04305 [Bacteroidetes bacterium QS_7_67_15]|nr:MAG: hypothetical protein BRD44_04305 [Bacteroidetes bacterium QS_7_67_15]